MRSTGVTTDKIIIASKTTQACERIEISGDGIPTKNLVKSLFVRREFIIRVPNEDLIESGSESYDTRKSYLHWWMCQTHKRTLGSPKGI